MAAQPVIPMPPAPEAAPLSEGARIVDTFIAPTKTFTDLRRSAAWWAPFLLMVIFSTVFVYVAGEKVGFRKAMENQMQAQPRQMARLEQLSAAEREQRLEAGAKFTAVIAYAFPVLQLLILLIISAVLFGTLKFTAGADIKFKAAFAVVMYATLPGLLRAVLATVSLLAGASPDSFTLQNPAATNLGYFLNPADSPFLYSLASSFDVFLIWTLILTAIGFTCVSKVKRGTALTVVFGWWLVFSLTMAGLAAIS